MGVLAHVVERDRAPASLQGLFDPTGSQLLLAERHQGAEGEFQQPLALSRQPFAPALFAYRNVVDERAAIKIDGRAQRVTAALADQGLEPADIAFDNCRIEPYDLAVALKGVLAEYLAQPGEGLAQVLLGLRVEVRAPQQ